MVLWFVSYTTPQIIVYVYDVSIIIVYDVSLLLSMTYQSQSLSFSGKTYCMDLRVIKLTDQVSPSSGFRVPHYSSNIQKMLICDTYLTV